MTITINQHRMRTGNHHQIKMKANAKQCNNKAKNNVNNTSQKKSLTFNINDIAPSHHVYQQRAHRFQLKQILCFILLLNNVRGHAMPIGEKTDILRSPLALNHYTQTLPLLNERLHVNIETMPNHQHDVDGHEKKNVE